MSGFHVPGFTKKIQDCPTCRTNKHKPFRSRQPCRNHPASQEIHHHHHYPPTVPPSYGPDYTWVESSSYSPLPLSAVRGGTDSYGHPIYVGRAHHGGDLIPAKVIPGRKLCALSYNGKEHYKTNYQVLCSDYTEWVPGFHGQVPPGAIEGGKTATGETLYIGRAHHDGTLTVGKVYCSHRTCYIAYGGNEIGYPNYEILIRRRF